MENKPKVYFVLGGPGAGKGTQSQKLVEKFGFVHLSAGDLLRAERKSGSSNGDLIESCITQGRIVPSEITVKLLQNAMKLNGLDKTYLIDGFPRNQENLESWNKTMGDSYHFKKLLFFDCDEKVMIERIMKRSELSGRSDDNTETLIKRFKVYKEETKPIIDYFQSLGQVNILMAEGSYEEVFDRLIQLIQQDQ